LLPVSLRQNQHSNQFVSSRQLLFSTSNLFSKELPGRRCCRFRLAEVANPTRFHSASQLLFSASILFSKASLVAVATKSLSEPQNLLTS
jgi:hypothetical protein